MPFDELVAKVGPQRHRCASAWTWRFGCTPTRYSNTVALRSFYGELAEEERRVLWAAYRDRLGSDDNRLADPVGDSRWIDFLGDQAIVEEGWREMTRRDVRPWKRRFGRVLQVAGVVPWASQPGLLEERAARRRMHHATFGALAGSAFDPFGDRGPGAAALLGRLDLPAQTPKLPARRARLAPAAGAPARPRASTRSS